MNEVIIWRLAKAFQAQNEKNSVDSFALKILVKTMKPFLKWAGNKYQITATIKNLLPEGKRLIEPFAGSGALFLNTDYEKYLLNDSNVDLIQTYRYLQTEGEVFINYCQQFFTVDNNIAEKFYELREEFNFTQDVRLKSALFIYLNKHCFNGLCRYNGSGKFNTPFGKYSKPYFPAKEMQYFYQKAQNAIFESMDFVACLEQAEIGDVVYCDPPYVPLSPTASFTGYAVGGFNLSQQQQLADSAEQLADQGIAVIISNHATEFTEQLYRKAQIHKFPVQRYISCKGDKRNKVEELLAVF